MYKVDPNRLDATETGIFIRAQHLNKWGNWDISTLDYASLMAWLRQDGGNNLLAEHTVAILLGHDVIMLDSKSDS